MYLWPDGLIGVGFGIKFDSTTRSGEGEREHTMRRMETAKELAVSLVKTSDAAPLSFSYLSAGSSSSSSSSSSASPSSDSVSSSSESGSSEPCAASSAFETPCCVRTSFSACPLAATGLVVELFVEPSLPEPSDDTSSSSSPLSETDPMVLRSSSSPSPSSLSPSSSSGRPCSASSSDVISQPHL